MMPLAAFSKDCWKPPLPPEVMPAVAEEALGCVTCIPEIFSWALKSYQTCGAVRPLIGAAPVAPWMCLNEGRKEGDGSVLICCCVLSSRYGALASFSPPESLC